MSLRYAKRIARRIEKFTALVEQENKRLEIVLKLLTPQENLDFGYDLGYIDEADYQIIRLKLDKEAERNEKNRLTNISKKVSKEKGKNN